MSAPRTRTPKLQATLQAILTEFTIELGLPTLPNGKVDKVRYNRAGVRLWQRLHRLRLFPKASGA